MSELLIFILLSVALLAIIFVAAYFYSKFYNSATSNDVYGNVLEGEKTIMTFNLNFLYNQRILHSYLGLITPVCMVLLFLYLQIISFGGLISDEKDNNLLALFIAFSFSQCVFVFYSFYIAKYIRNLSSTFRASQKKLIKGIEFTSEYISIPSCFLDPFDIKLAVKNYNCCLALKWEDIRQIHVPRRIDSLPNYIFYLKEKRNTKRNYDHIVVNRQYFYKRDKDFLENITKYSNVEQVILDSHI